MRHFLLTQYCFAQEINPTIYRFMYQPVGLNGLKLVEAHWVLSRIICTGDLHHLVVASLHRLSLIHI